jgi:acetylornithine deacetylase
MDTLALARRLIDIPSTTDNEGAVGTFLFDELTRLGYSCQKQAVSETRFNVFASAGGHPGVVLNSHIDTVPPWFGAREDETHIYGRGACDTKGILAAMIAAGERLRVAGTNGFAFLFVVGEETDSIGAKSANAAFKDLGSDYILVGEPTESTFARAAKGALTAFVRFDGIAGHSAYPERGDSAIRKMVNAISEIHSTDWGSHEVLGQATVNVGAVRGGEKPNVIAASAECDMIFRTVEDPDSLKARLETLVARHGGHITLWRGNAPQFMHVPAGAGSTVVAFNSDIPWLSNLGKPLLFGPGSILDAHGANEKIEKKELLDAVGTYVETVEKLLRGD